MVVLLIEERLGYLVSSRVPDLAVNSLQAGFFVLNTFFVSRGGGI